MTPSSNSADGRHGLSSPERLERGSGVHAHLLQSGPAERGQEQGAPRTQRRPVDRCTGTHLRRRGQLEPAQGLVLVSAEQVDERTPERQRRVVGEQRIPWPAQPPLDRREAAVVVHGSRRPLDQGDELLLPARPPGVGDRLLVVSLPERPVGCAGGDRLGEPGLAAQELAAQRITERGVEAIRPRAAVGRRDDEQQRARQLLQPRRRAGDAQRGVAQRTGKLVERRDPLEKAHVLAVEGGQAFLAEVLDDKAIRAVECRSRIAVGLEYERGEVEPGRPALHALDEAGQLVVGDVDARAPQESAGLVLRHPQVFRPELDRAPSVQGVGQRVRRTCPAGEQQPRPRRETRGQREEHVEAPLRGEQVQVVDRKVERAAAARLRRRATSRTSPRSRARRRARRRDAGDRCRARRSSARRTACGGWQPQPA